MGLRFDGRTVIVTGAGGKPSLGRAHAMLFASLGARVVVNDIGARAETPNYPYPASAEAVAAEIRALGGDAVADENSVATVEGAQAVVATALGAFGSLDVLVNNAAFSVPAPFDELTPRDFQTHIEVNLLGAAWMCRAAWPHMKAKGYGRIVNTTSSGLAGAGGLSAYCASKGGLLSLTKSLAAEGERWGIKVNAINPSGFTRLVMATQREDSAAYQRSRDTAPAELSSPMTAFLAHEACPVTGECVDSFGGLARRMYISVTPGFTDAEITIDAIARRWDEVMAGTDPGAVAYKPDDVLLSAPPYRPEERG
jgi:NAD(P)-dependent dehydrogenase (short-subunit alcohol dehydrogenase family)